MFVNPSKATAIGNTLFASVFPSAVVILLSLQHNKVHISRSNRLWVRGDKPESEFDSSQSFALRRVKLHHRERPTLINHQKMKHISPVKKKSSSYIR